MERYKKQNLYTLLVSLVVATILFVYSEYFCTGSCYVVYEAKFLDPLTFLGLGFAASVLVLLFFHGKVFISWVKHIAWWFVIFAAVMVANTDQGGFLPFYDRVQVALFWMTVLFLITLIYAPLMQRHVRKQADAKIIGKDQ